MQSERRRSSNGHPKRSLPRFTAGSLVLAWVALGAAVWAQAPSPEGARSDGAVSDGAVSDGAVPPRDPKLAVEQIARTRAAGKQRAIAIGKHGEQVLVAVCKPTCNWADALVLETPPEIARALTPGNVALVELGERKTALHLRVEQADAAWEALIAGSLEHDHPLIAFAGATGWTAGEFGERTGQALRLFDAGTGGARPERIQQVVVGKLDEAVQICGRETLLAPELLHTPSMRLRRVKLQRLSQAERDAAARVEARPSQAGRGQPLLRTLVASSAKGSPQAVTDGDPTTAWSEGRSGDGAGEFVVMRAPAELDLVGFELRVRPTASASATGAAPRTLWLAFDQGLVHVTLPEDSFAEGSTSLFRIDLPGPVRTGCVAIVLDSAHAEPGARELDVTISEFSASSALGPDDLRAAVRALAGAEPDASAAAALLSVFGELAAKQIAAEFAQLSETARLRALSVLDSLECEHSARTFVRALVGSEAERAHASASLRACGPAAKGALLRGFRAASGPPLDLIGALLLELDPAQTVVVARAELAKASEGKRKQLRAIVRRAADHDAGAAALRDALANADAQVALELLRAADELLPKFQPEASALALRLSSGKPNFRTRYLLVEPLSRLAATDEAAAGAFAGLLRDPDPHVRAAAARVASVERPVVLDALLIAVDDPQVRVRQAAVQTLGEQRVARALPKILARMEKDEWPLVRAAAVRAVRELPGSRSVFAALADATEDDSAEVRRPALLSLGLMGAQSELDSVRGAYEDEDPYVQAAAAAALAQLCDREMIDELTEAASKLASLSASERDGIVGRAAIAALGRLRPPDLARRLAPLQQGGIPVMTRAAAEAALAHPEPCPKSAPTKQGAPSPAPVPVAKRSPRVTQ